VERLKELTPPELLVMHAAISEELRRRNITRSSNNPVGDFAEHLFWPPRSFAADAHECIMVRVMDPPDTRSWRD
jgi:hypothetical protein